MRQLFILAMAVTFCVSSGGQSNGVEALGPPPKDLAISAAVVEVLDSHGNRLKLADGIICDIWLRKTVPAQTAKRQAEGLLYPELSESTLIGVISFSKAATDF